MDSEVTPAILPVHLSSGVHRGNEQ